MIYDWRQDAYGSWLFYMRMMALAVGAVRFATLPEMYWVESKEGGIP